MEAQQLSSLKQMQRPMEAVAELLLLLELLLLWAMLLLW